MGNNCVQFFVRLVSGYEGINLGQEFGDASAVREMIQVSRNRICDK